MRARGAMSGEPSSRTKVVVALFAAVALLAAVVVLRGQVEPTQPAASPSSEPAATEAPSLSPLPVRPNRRQSEWRHYTLPPGSMQVLADRSYLTVLRDGPAGQLSGTALVMLRRDTAEQVIGYPVTEGWRPSQWALHGDGLLVMELQESFGERAPLRWPVTRLRWIQLGTQAVRELPLRSVQALRPHGMYAVGEDVLVVGSVESPEQTCVVAVRPATATDRTVQCRPGLDRGVWLMHDGSGIRWTFSGMSSMCEQWYELAADGSARAMSDDRLDCPDPLESSIGGWTVGVDDPGAQHPRLRARGPDGERLTLDESGYVGVACGRHYYWTSFIRNEPRIMRWRPGTDHTHVALAGTGKGVPELYPNGCVDGVLTVPVTLPATDGRATMEVWVLDQP